MSKNHLIQRHDIREYLAYNQALANKNLKKYR